MKLRKIYTSAGILLLSLFCIGDAVAKDAKFETGVSFGSTGADEPYSSLTDKDGNYYISGMCRGDVEFAGGATIKGRGGMDAVIVKYDAELNFLWARAVGGSKDDTFERIAVTSAGDIVAVGKISGDVTIDGTEQTLSGTQSTDGCIVVYDKDGNYKSSAQIKAAGASLCYSVAVDKSDNIFVTGSTVGATDFGNEKTVTIEGSNPGTFLACYNNSLVCQWAIAGSSPVQSYGWAVNFDKEENILLTGRFGTTFTITGTDGEALTTAVGSESSQDTYVAKLSHEGVGQWITYVTNSNRIDTRSIDSDSQGNVYIWGHCQSAVTPEGQSPLGFNGNFDSFLIKYSSAGAYLDGMNLGGSGRDEAKSLFVDADDNIYVAGNVNGDGSKGGTAVNMNPRGESKDYTFKGHDGYVAKYNGSTWELMQLEKTVTPDNANQHEVAWCVTMSPDYNKVYVTGYFNNGATVFDGASLTLPFVQDYDIYTVLYSYTLMVKTKTLEPVAAALSDFQAISQTVGTLKGGTVGADNLADELSSDLESQEAVVDKPVTAIVIGAGARGRTYASYSEHYPNSLKIVGVADINTERKEYMKNLYRIPDEHCFSDWKEVFNVPKFADAVIIATPDNLHYAPALKAMAAGYDLLLEKPVAQSIKECTDILKYAKRYDRIVGICHVLRYAPYFIALKKVLDSGKIGELVSIQHMECIRYHHMAHSYVRGNWKSSKDTTPIIIAKSCHDMDMMRWLVNKPCKSVSAYGGLKLFKRENAPDGSTERCLDCPVESQCPYSAKKIYLQRRQFLYVFDIPDNDCKNYKYDSLILDKLRTSDYGRCVYRCDNDQCDHFVASLEFDNNITGAFSMEAFTATGGRLTRVMGTKGWIEGDMKKFTVTDFLTNKKLVWNKDISSLPGYEGHAGGDFGIVKDFVLAVAHRDTSYLTSTIDLSIESHVMGFLAEKSRVLKKRIDM